MIEDAYQLNQNGKDEVHTDSLRFKVAQNERAINRLKEENGKQKERIDLLEDQIATIKRQNKALIDKISKRQNDYARLLSQKEALERTIQVRTQRHVAQQQQNLTKGDRQLMQRRVKEAQEQMMQYKLQAQKSIKQCHSLLNQVQNERALKLLLENQMIDLSRKERHNEQKVAQLEKLYSEKIKIQQIENRQLRYNLEDVILQLKLHERKQEIQGLLTYEDRIGTNTYSKLKQSKNYQSTSHQKTAEPKGSQLPYADTFRERDCRCFELTEELIDYEQMVELIKQRNQRLENQLEAFKRRCITLQNIICTQNGQFFKK